jgi:molecular chaperone GrpE
MNEKPDESANLGGPERGDSATAHLEAGQDIQALLQELTQLRTENADLRDRLLRAMAEMENFRRRSDRDKSDGMKYAVSEFARDAVTIGDNLRRAIEAAQKEPLEQNPPLKTLLEGVEVTERELFKVFERHGITRFDPLGEKFDPHVHEAMVKVDVPGVPADVVVQVLQAGYKIGDRVLRPAAVIVAKGGTPARPAQPESIENSAGATADGGAANENDARARHTGLQVNTGHDHDPDVIRDPAGAPRGSQGQGRGRERPAGDKRPQSMTKPVTEDAASIKKDDLISSFGKRLENGGS